MELSYRRAQLLELSRILAQCFENVNRYEDFARVDRSEALSAVRRRVQKQIFNFTIAEKDGEPAPAEEAAPAEETPAAE